MSGTEYGISTTVQDDVPSAIARVKETLASQGFGVLTEIDIAATLKTKLGVDVPAQVVLGACNPVLAHRALQSDEAVGLLLPCNVVVREGKDGATIVEAIDPAALAPATGSAGLAVVADEARERLAAAISALNA